MVINFFGKRGAGKTTTIKGQLKDCRKPIVIVDVLGNFNDPSYIQSKDLPDTIRKLNKLRAQLEKGEVPEKHIIALQTHDYDTAIDYLCAALWEIWGGTLILDEIDAVSISEAPCFDQAIRYGRNHNIDMITGCRRPAELDRNISAAGNKFYCFGTHEWRDVEYFRENGFGDRAFELQKVPPFSGLFLDYDTNQIGHFHIDREGNIYHDDVEDLRAL